MNQQSFDIAAALRQEPLTASKSVGGSARFSWNSLFTRSEVSGRSLIVFCTQLSVMVLSKVPLHRALEVLEVQTPQGLMREAIISLRKNVSSGSSISAAMRSHPGVFDELFIVTAEVGEESGRLGEVFSSLAKHLEKIEGLKKKTIQALTYPVLVMLVAFGAVSFLMAFIVPTFADMFKSFQMELPWSTRIVIQISDAVSAYGAYLVLAVVLIGFALKKSFEKPAVRSRLEQWTMGIPYWGTLIQQNYLARFCRTLGTLLKSQVTLVDALSTTQRIITQRDLKEEISRIMVSVKSGRNIAGPVSNSALFPPMIAQMIVVGEETSELDDMLLKVADYYEKGIDDKIEILSTTIEPVLIMLVGMLVALILVAMYLPMFDIVNSIAG